MADAAILNLAKTVISGTGDGNTTNINLRAKLDANNVHWRQRYGRKTLSKMTPAAILNFQRVIF